jgi:hypothetical protein
MTNHNSRPRGDNFPCASLDEALRHLRRPPAPAALRFKIQNAVDEAAQVVAYVDARLVFDRLDLVCTPGAGRPPSPSCAGRFCRGPRTASASRATRRCMCAAGSSCSRRRARMSVRRRDQGGLLGRAQSAPPSGSASGARSCLGALWLREGGGDGELRRNGKGRLFIDERTEEWLRGGYERWIERRGIPAFGEPLPHGDEAGAPGFEAEGDPSGSVSDEGNQREAVDGIGAVASSPTAARRCHA